MARTTPPGGPAGPHELPLSEQQHRLVIEGRRLDSGEVCTVVLIWDFAVRSWVFYLHGSAGMAARFSRADTEAAARHVLDRKAS